LNARELVKINVRDILFCLNELCKSTFTITIKYPSIYKILSNIKVLEETVAEDDRDMRSIRLSVVNKEHLMSADNITIIINKLVPLSDLNSAVVFWCRKNETENMQYAKAIASSALQYIIKHIAQENINIQKLNYVAVWNPQDGEMKTRELVLHR